MYRRNSVVICLTSADTKAKLSYKIHVLHPHSADENRYTHRPSLPISQYFDWSHPIYIKDTWPTAEYYPTLRALASPRGLNKSKAFKSPFTLLTFLDCQEFYISLPLGEPLADYSSDYILITGVVSIIVVSYCKSNLLVFA